MKVLLVMLAVAGVISVDKCSVNSPPKTQIVGGSHA